jgi:Tfp pilus assembly protein PilZ
MRTKPWPLLLLAVLQILTPVGTILMNAWGLGVKPLYILQWILERPAIDIFETLFLMPIAGIALYQMKAWSYAVFLAALGWGLVANMRHWNYAAQAFPIWKMLIVYGFQFLLVIYFMIPSVRKIYLDRSVRWWEAKRRFSLKLPVRLMFGAGEFQGTMQNISEGGMLMQSDSELETGKVVTLFFHILDRQFEVPGQVRYVMAQSQGGRVYGIQFQHSHETLARFKKLVRGLELMGIEDRDQAFKKPWYQGMREWVVTFLKTGKGLVPEIKSTRKS